MALTLDIVTPERRVLSVTCDEVRAPGAAGGFGIRANHEPFMTALEPGRLTVRRGRPRAPLRRRRRASCRSSDNRVIVLADTAEAAADIDVERAQARLPGGAGAAPRA